MLVDAHTLRLLKSNDPKQRRQAIVALAESRDPNALKHLAVVARTDLNPKLRELAVRAQKHLKETLEFASQASDTPAAVYTSEEESRARDYMDEATSMFIANQPVKAATSLLKALRANPALKHDSYFRSLAGTIFDTTPDEGLAMLIDQERRGQFTNTQKQEQGKESDHMSQSSEIGWNLAWFDLVIYGVIIVIITFLILLIFSPIVIQSSTPYQIQSPTVHYLHPLVIGLFLIVALLNSVVNIIGMLIQGGVIHLVATRLLQGVGKLPFLLTQTVPFYSMMIVITGAIFILWGAFMIFTDAEAAMVGAICIGPIIVLASFFSLFKTADKIGKAYNFGFGKGCLSLIITTLLIWLVTFVITQAMLFSSGIFLRLHNLMDKPIRLLTK